MRTQRNSHHLVALFLLGALLASSGAAAAVACSYGSAGMGGSGMTARGTGMGGTGAVARGTGMGGTGVRSEDGKGEMQLAGNVMFTQGSVEAQRDGQTRMLAMGDPVCVGETLVTGQSGRVQIKMADEALV